MFLSLLLTLISKTIPNMLLRLIISASLFCSIFPLSAQTVFDSLVPYYRDTIYFATGLAELVDSSKLVLSKAQSQLRPDAQLHLTGHTDARGSDAANQKLAERRSNAASNYLKELGIVDSLIFIDAYGESIPVADNTSDLGRKKNRRVTIGLYQIEKMIKLDGRIKDKETGQGISALLRFHGKGFNDSLRTDSSGKYSYSIPEGTIVGREIFAHGYFYQSDMFKAVFGKLPPLEVELPKAKEGRSMDLPEFFFYGNQYVLLPKSEPQLDNLLRFMQINPGLSIEIEGHVNRPNEPPVAEDSWSFELSVNRARMVYEYLLENGIEANRVQYKGYGNSKMRYPRARSEEHQSANRRVEIRILSAKTKLGSH